MDASTTGAASGALSGASLGPWGAVAGGVIGMLGAGSGSDAAAKANADNLAFQKQMYQQQDPFSAGGNRAQYVPKLNELAMGGPTSIANDPTFHAMNDKSMSDMTRQMEASGQAGSGQAMTSLQQNSQQNQMSYWQNMMQTYAGLSGASGGKTSPIQGQSSGEAFGQANATQANYGAGFGSIVSGLSAIYNSGGSTGGSSGGAGSMNGSGSVQGNPNYFYDI